MQVFLTLENYLKLQDDLQKKLSYIRETIDEINASMQEVCTDLVEIYKDEYGGQITEDNFVIFKAKVKSQLEVISAVKQYNLEVEKKLLLEVGDSISMSSLLLKHVPLYVEETNIQVVSTAMKQGMLVLLDMKKQITASINQDSPEV